MALEISGKLIKIQGLQSGQSKNGSWQKQEFVIETPDQFPKKVCFSVWGDKVADLSKFSAGDNIKVSFNLESREYNDKWYTDARAWRIESENAGQPAGNHPAPASDDNFGFEPYTPSSQGSNVSVDDDLPF